ncbi:MAG: HupE/UreJ family protein [Limisphaerales bacterium]
MKGLRGGLGFWWVVLGLLALAPKAAAHKSSDSYLRVTVGDARLTGLWHLALHDLEFAVGLDANGNGEITWGELKARKDAVMDYAKARLDLDWDGRRLRPSFDSAVQVEQLANGGYVVLRWEVSGEGGRSGSVLRVGNRVFFDSNPLHRGLIVVEQGETVHQGIFNPRETQLQFDLTGPEPANPLPGFFWEGVHHIGLGYDHVLFLLVLLLPAVLKREAGRWTPEEKFWKAFWNVVRIVTAFTLAHSVTLSLSALGWVSLPSRWVEPAIAFSIVIASLNNLAPILRERAWTMAFGFGLVHGFGFASVLADLGLPRGNLVEALVGFNLGVEAGQLAIVLLVLPVFHAIRRRAFYRVGFLGGGSVAAALLAGWWMWERLGGTWPVKLPWS